MANSAVFFGALVGVVAFLASFSLHKIEEGMVTSGASCVYSLISYIKCSQVASLI